MSPKAWVTLLPRRYSLEKDSMRYLKTALWKALLLVPEETHDIAKKNFFSKIISQSLFTVKYPSKKVLACRGEFVAD